MVSDGQGTIYMVAASADGERGLQAGTLTTNTNKLAFIYSSHEQSNATEVKTIGCVLVHVSPKAITTKLVFLDESRSVQVANEYVTDFDTKGRECDSLPPILPSG